MLQVDGLARAVRRPDRHVPAVHPDAPVGVADLRGQAPPERVGDGGLGLPAEAAGGLGLEARVLLQAYLEGAAWEVDVAGRTYPAVVSLRPLYDPEMKRMRG